MLIDEETGKTRNERTQKLAKRCKTTARSLFRVLAGGRPSLVVSVAIQRASKGAILPEEWL